MPISPMAGDLVRIWSHAAFDASHPLAQEHVGVRLDRGGAAAGRLFDDYDRGTLVQIGRRRVFGQCGGQTYLRRCSGFACSGGRGEQCRRLAPGSGQLIGRVLPAYDVARCIVGGRGLSTPHPPRAGHDADVCLDPTAHWMLFSSTRESDHAALYLQRTSAPGIMQLTSGAVAAMMSMESSAPTVNASPSAPIATATGISTSSTPTGAIPANSPTAWRPNYIPPSAPTDRAWPIAAAAPTGPGNCG